LKKKHKKKEAILVGIHVRRTDYDSMEKHLGWTPIKVGYFLQAMEIYRKFFANQTTTVLFLLISDDIQWAKDVLLPQVGRKDLYIAGKGGDEKHDR